MGRNIVRKTFVDDGSWTAPAGVTCVKVMAFDAMSTITVGVDNAACITDQGGIAVWGRNNSGQLILATGTTGRSSASKIASSVDWKKISAGKDYYLAISNSGQANNLCNIAGFGLNANGQLGDASVTARSAPTLVTTGNVWFKDISAGNAQSVGVGASGDLYAWGINTNGNLGDGTVTARSIPTLVLRSLTWKQAACSGDTNLFMAGITEGGDAYAWGLNANGQLGVGDVTPRSSPVIVLGSKTWKSISCGDAFTVAIDTAGAMYAWGLNTHGQLGVGDVTPRSSPVAVLGGKTWLMVAAGASHVLALDTSNEAYSWGLNANGQLGQNSVTPKSSPVIVSGSLKWTDLGAGGATSGGVTTSGLCYMWGVNTYGQLGTNDTTPRSTPVAITSVGGSNLWRAYKKTKTKELYVDVTPGTTYTISMLANTVTFGDTSIVGSIGCTELILEYYT